MRQVTLVISPEFVESIGGSIDQKTAYAIGYLSTWAIGSDRYHSVTIYANERRIELEAVYKNKDGETTYTMGAVRDALGTYSFHS